MEHPSPVRLITLSRLLKLPATWLKEEADAGRIPCLRVGRARLFDPAAVQQTLRRRAAAGEGVDHD